ncbi:MAG: TonB-dependent receptor [Acidobacteria bacterium]|nr:TonB-dependent receptor [Acidobacteriota bacterium]MCI0622274.1 TonB-dependent receptor [Acidobacteriota bacterium]MCI0718980.1 TonB-dependent receptor [Acidobacteriota bacterium]
MKPVSRLYPLGLVCLCLFALAREVRGQATQSTILGTVTDPSGAVVTGATVTVKNEGTNIERTIVADANGDYRVAGLETGSYQVSVSAAGFKKFVQTKVVLNASQIKRVDTKLELGEISDTVTVDGGVGHLETETATLSNIKTTQDYQELPLSIFGRGWANITNVVAGVQSESGFEVNGARDTGNNFTTDGISVNDIISSRNTANGFSGDVEALGEIKVMTANNSAEYAQVAQFSAASRAGSNQLHGTLYWGNFNSVFSARNWNDPSDPSFTNHNMFNVNNGGPVYIPKLYNGRDRTFYFFSYGGARYRIGNRLFYNLPTPAFRQGDFSSLLGKINVVDPLTGVPFPGNRIPAGRISPVSKAMQDLIYPDPNLTGTGDFGLERNFTADPGGQFNSDVYSIRVDHKLADNNNLFVRVGVTKTNQDKYPGGLKQGYGGPSALAEHPGRSVVVSDTHTFNPTLVNELKLGYSRDNAYGNETNFGKAVQTGLQGIGSTDDPAATGLPYFFFSGATGFQGTDSWGNRWSQRQNTYQVIDNLSWYRGRHTFKMGGDIRRYQVNDENKPASLRGTFIFDDQLSGFDYANFLLGLPSSAERAIARPNAYLRSTHVGFYFQDDFKINQRITFNYGLRYENQTPWVDKFDRLFTFDPKTGSLVTAGTTVPNDLVPAVAATLPIITASRAGFPTRSLFEKDRNNWNPRMGLAIRPFSNATTVVRLGYGMFTQIWPGLLGLNATGGPWQSTESFFIEGNQPSIQFPNPFLKTGDFSGVQSVSGLSPNFPNERTHQWNFSVGREIWGTAVDIGYVGTKALNVPFFQNLNLLRPSTQPYSSARRPYPRFDEVGLTQSGGSSIYHGFNIQADRRMARGLTFNANYTWAKALTDVDLRDYAAGAEQNQYQRFLERGDDRNIRRQQLRFSYIYELPVGKGRRFLSGLRGPANKLLEGWQVAGITTMVTGERLSPSFSGTDPANTNQFGGRPDRVGDGNFGSGNMRDLIKSGRPIFDKSAFAIPQSGRGSYGNSARNILTGPGEANWNIVMAKNFYVKERARLQFRWEMFNAFNRPNFGNPSTRINSGSFGLVTGAGASRSMLVGLRLQY